MRTTGTRNRCVIKVMLAVFILVQLIIWNSGCTGCSNKDDIHKEAYARGRAEGSKIGYKQGYSKGYKNGTLFFLGKWWKPSLGLLIIAAVFVVALFSLYRVLVKPTRRLVAQLEEQTEKYLVQLKVNKEMERKLKSDESTEKHRHTLIMRDHFDTALQQIGETDNPESLRQLKEEAERAIRKATASELEAVVEDYKKRMRLELTKSKVRERNQPRGPMPGDVNEETGETPTVKKVPPPPAPRRNPGTLRKVLKKREVRL